MKILMMILLLIQASWVSALELQCQTPWEDVLMVIKTSPETQTTYLLFLNDEGVEKYWPLPHNFITDNLEHFLYADSETQIEINKQKLTGLISSEENLFRNERLIPLNHCLNL